jgi:NADPH:quinone reductase-like Zn-dependent oxidoreductase
MRALRFNNYGKPSVLAIEEIPRPALRAGEVLVKVIAAGVNRSDVATVGGAFKSEIPRTPGRDFAGVIVEGADAGMEVWGSGAGFGITRDGAHAEFVAVPRSWLAPKPANLSMGPAAACGVPFIIALAAVDSVGKIQAGETLLVTGAEGAVGRAATQIAHWRKARVIGVQRSSHPADADDVIDTSTQDLIEAVTALTGGKGVDIALDTVGGDLFEPALRTLRLGGRQIAVASRGKKHVEFDLVDFYHNAATLHGVDSLGFSGERLAAVQDQLRLAFEVGALQAPAIAEVPLDRAVGAYEAVDRGARDRQVLILN